MPEMVVLHVSSRAFRAIQEAARRHDTNEVVAARRLLSLGIAYEAILEKTFNEATAHFEEEEDD